jgi:hypothetical protein
MSYDKLAANYLAFVQLPAIRLWLCVYDRQRSVGVEKLHGFTVQKASDVSLARVSSSRKIPMLNGRIPSRRQRPAIISRLVQSRSCGEVAKHPY